MEMSSSMWKRGRIALLFLGMMASLAVGMEPAMPSSPSETVVPPVPPSPKVETKTPDTSALLEEIRELRKRLDALEKTSESKSGKEKAPDKDPSPDKSTSKSADTEKDKAKDKGKENEKKEKLKTDEPMEYEVGKNMKMEAIWNNGVQLSTEDRCFTFHIGGRVDFDNTWYTQDSNILLGGNNNARLEDGSDFRRLRLRADGTMWEWIDYVCEVNFANIQDFSNAVPGSQQIGSVGLTDVSLIFRETPLVGNAKVGHFLSPFGLEHYSGTLVWYYMERSPQFDAFVNRFDYVNGLQFFDSYLDDRVTYAATIFRSGGLTINPFGSGAGDGEYGFGVRFTGLPIASDDNRKLVHLGFSYSQRAWEDKNEGPGARPSVRGGAGRDIPNVIQNGNFFASDPVHYVSPEIAFILGPFSMSSELLWVYTPKTYADRDDDSRQYVRPRGSYSTTSFYVEAGLFLTPGDCRRYNRKLGIWDRTLPVENGFLVKDGNGSYAWGRGAVQLLARYARPNLVGGTPVITPDEGARAGLTHDITLGVAYYLNPQSWIMVNYVHTYINSVVAGRSGAFDGLGLRFHYDF